MARTRRQSGLPRFRRVVLAIIFSAALLTNLSGHDSLTIAQGVVAPPNASERELAGGKWTWWACAILAAGTIVTCSSGNVVGCVMMVVSYSQNC